MYEYRLLNTCDFATGDQLFKLTRTDENGRKQAAEPVKWADVLEGSACPYVLTIHEPDALRVREKLENL